jgi:hypothetical protein
MKASIRRHTRTAWDTAPFSAVDAGAVRHVDSTDLAGFTQPAQRSI